jgi:pimeloyl-ACP methyl ester carboxylesterase
MSAVGAAQSIQETGAPAGDGAMQRLVVDGIDIVRRAGTADQAPVVLLHGIGSNAGSFEPLIACLARNRAVIAWDCPGYGRSAPLAAEWPLAQNYSEALRLLLDRLNVERAVFVGHSLGAIIAARFAATNLERTAGVALISPAVGYRTPPGTPLPDGARARVDELARLGPKAFAAARARGLVHEADRKPQVTARVEAAMAAVQLRGYVQAARMLASAWIFDDAAALQAPTVVMCGANDRVTTPEQSKRVADAVPPPVRIGGDVVLIADAGHAVTQERPEEVAQHLAGLMDAQIGHRHA